MASTTSDYRKQIYARYASTRGGAAAADERAREPFFRKLLRYLPDPGARVFEVGAGTGGLLRYLMAQGFQDVRGVDGSSEQVARAERDQAPVVLGDAMAALRALPDASVDVVVALDVVEHFDKGEAFAMLGEFHRVLSPGGRCLIHTVNADSPFFGTIRYGDYTHETAFNRTSMTQVLRTHGFQQVDCFEDRPIVHGAKSLARAAIWEVARTVATVVLAAETGALGGRILSQNFLTVAIK